MSYLKATAVGIIAAVIFGAVWTWAALQFPMWWQMWQQRNEGVGVGVSRVASDSILLAAVIGFILGFSLTVRRASN
jgi:hypothetical protein